ncbi:MAG: tetratricopeptide repeat protein [Hyphomonadaceae bacterium]|nr:tetratricopeptide repeat protein [Hyphomonadaceae bacterium]
MMRCAAVAFAAILAAPAQAAVTMIGDGPARACYAAALAGDGAAHGLRACDDALGSDQLAANDRAATMINRGVIRLQRREARLALADFDTAVAWRPLLAEGHVNRGAALILLGETDAAIAAITHGLSLQPRDPHEAYFNRALAHEQNGDVRAAYADFRRAAELAPTWTLAQAELARFEVRPRQ